MIHRKHFIWFAGLMVTALLILAGCGQGKAEYTVTVSGDSVQEGVITILDYSINVYKDEASNSCGDCEKQPVHLYAGADAEDVAEAIKDCLLYTSVKNRKKTPAEPLEETEEVEE